MHYYCPTCWHEIEPDLGICPECGSALSSRTEDLVDKYIAAIRHPEPTRASLAIYVLGKLLHEPRAVGPLIDLIETSDNAYTAAEAVKALGWLGDRRAVPAVGRLLLAPTTPLVVRIAAVEALREIGGRDAQALLRLASTDHAANVRADVEAAASDTEPAQ